jgi:hypothetical protein
VVRHSDTPLTYLLAFFQADRCGRGRLARRPGRGRPDRLDLSYASPHASVYETVLLDEPVMLAAQATAAYEPIPA